MPPVTLATIVDLSKIKMKWKETYVSEGLNRKVIPATPRGIYSGLRMVQNISSPRQVQISAAPDTVHAAVALSASGFSTTYHDVGGTAIILNLSSASLDNTETVIALSINYTVGADTTANWIAYPISDWNALTSAQQAALIVVGTVNVPAAAANITTAMINMKRRSWAWENAGGEVAWSPLLKNTSFEHAAQSTTYTNIASYWSFTNGPDALWTVELTDPHSGVASLQLDHQLTGVQNASFEQRVGAPVVPGQLLKYQLFIKNLKVAAGGSLQLWLRFVAADWVTNTDVQITIPTNAIDATYREFSDTIAVPTNCVQLVSANIVYALNQGTTGVAIRLDDFQVWLAATAGKPAGTEDRSRQHISTEQVVFEDANDPYLFYYGNATLVRQSVESLIIERRDQNTNGNPVLITPKNAVLRNFGGDLLNTEARALMARIEAPPSTTVNVDFTLMWQSKAAGQPGFRSYVSPNGSYIETYNAIWSGTGWAKDVGGIVAVKRSLTNLENRVDLRHAVNNAGWGDGSWDQTSMVETWGSPISTWQIVASASISGDVTLGNNSSVQLSGASGLYKHGTRTLRWMTSNGSAAFLAGSSPSNTTGESFGTGSTAAGTWFCPLNPWPSTWRLTAARFFLPNTIVGTGGLFTLQERNGSGYTSISSDFTLTAGQSGLQTLAGISAAAHAFPIGVRMNLSVGSTTTALVSFVEIDYDVV